MLTLSTSFVCAQNIVTNTSFTSAVFNNVATGTSGDYSYTSTNTGTGTYNIAFTNNGASDVDGLGQNDTHTFSVNVSQYLNPVYTLNADGTANVSSLGTATDFGQGFLNAGALGDTLISVSLDATSFTAGETSANTAGYIDSDVTFNSVAQIGDSFFSGGTFSSFGGDDLAALTAGGTAPRPTYTGSGSDLYVFTSGVTNTNRIRHAYVEFDVTTTFVPEPTSAGLLGLGGLVLITRRKR